MAVTTTYGAAPTYVKIASQTLASSTATVTFSNIPQGYTDLVINIAIAGLSTAETPRMYFNGDTSSIYSTTFLDGNGSSILTNRTTNNSSFYGIGAYNSGNPTGVSHIVVNINSYSNTVTNKTMLARNASSLSTTFTAGLYRSTAPISSISFFVHPGSTTYSTGTVFTVYGIKAAIGKPKASGGDVVYSDGTYWYHKFLSSGVFSTNTLTSVDYLVVAGGGGAAGYISGGGGGGGGLLTGTSAAVTANTNYAVTVGAGGGSTGNSSGEGLSGGNSVFSSYTAVGGGGGSHAYASLYYKNEAGKNGGSGGGGGGTIDDSTGAGGTGTVGQGNNGGAGANRGNGGGGGGAGGAGTAGTGTVAGKGGAGTTSTFTGSNVYYSAGGGGGYWVGVGETFAGAATGGVGVGTAGNPNTGQGASSANNAGSTRLYGGSGIVILRYTV